MKQISLTGFFLKHPGYMTEVNSFQCFLIPNENQIVKLTLNYNNITKQVEAVGDGYTQRHCGVAL